MNKRILALADIVTFGDFMCRNVNKYRLRRLFRDKYKRKTHFRK